MAGKQVLLLLSNDERAPTEVTSAPKWENFHWWNSDPYARYGRPPSPFPASFETPRRSRKEDVELFRAEDGRRADTGCGAQTVAQNECNGLDLSGTNILDWPLCNGPPEVVEVTADVIQMPTSSQMSKKKTRVPGKKAPWIPPQNLSKKGPIFHPPPYTNYCKETIFDRRTSNPMKLKKPVSLKA